MAAPAYRDGGLIMITFDEGSDSAACCGGDAAMPQVRSFRPDVFGSYTRSTTSGSARHSASPTRTPPSRTWISFGGCGAAASRTVTAPAWTGSSRVRGARTNHDADVRSR